MSSPHPTQTPRLYLLLLSALGTGVVGLICVGNLDREFRDLAPLLNWVIICAFALFVIFCAVLAVAWVMREHAVWRESGGLAAAVAQAKQRAYLEAEEKAAWQRHQRAMSRPRAEASAEAAVEPLRNAAPAAEPRDGDDEPPAGSAGTRRQA